MLINDDLKKEVERLIALYEKMVVTHSEWIDTPSSDEKKKELWIVQSSAKRGFYNDAPEMIQCIKKLWKMLNEENVK